MGNALTRPVHALASAFLFTALVSGICACADDSEESSTDGHGMQQHDTHGDSTQMDFCAMDARAPKFVWGSLTASGALTLTTLMHSSPIVPVVGNNEFVLHIKDHQGNVLDGVTIAASTWMPDHNHGSPSDALIQSTAAPELGAGHYRVHPINFHMAGYWELTLRLNGTGPNAQPWSDSAVLPICINP